MHDAVFDCTLASGGGRNQCDNNSFMVYRKAYLACDSGTRGVNNPEQKQYSDGEHHENYFAQTIAHNSITVGTNCDPSPLCHTVLGGQVSRVPLDWLKTYGLPATDANRWSRQAGTIQAYETTPEFCYAVGDARCSYDPDVVKAFTRQLLYLRPGVIVLFDRVRAAKPQDVKRWYLHTMGQPLCVDGQLTPDSRVHPDGHFLASGRVLRSVHGGSAVKFAGTPTPAFNVMNYGAVGNDGADDTTKIQAAITEAAAVSGTVFVPAGTYRINNALTVPANTTISGSGTIHQVTSGRYGLRITGNNVTIEGITLTGRHSTPTYAGSEYAIFGRGKSAVAPFSGITIRNVTISKWGAYGIYLEYVTGFSVTGANIFDIGYTGIGVLSGTNGNIASNRIVNITPGADMNMYGIALTYGGAGGAANPDTSDVVVAHNTISNVAWEGLDSHGRGGKDGITVTNNDFAAATAAPIAGEP